jgi:hypothetical protein
MHRSIEAHVKRLVLSRLMFVTRVQSPVYRITRDCLSLVPVIRRPAGVEKSPSPENGISMAENGQQRLLSAPKVAL